MCSCNSPVRLGRARRCRRALALSAAAAVAGAASAGIANGATIAYSGGGPAGDRADWNNPSNWAGNVKPGSGDVAVFNDAGLKNAGSGVVTIDTGADQSVGQVVLGGPAFPLTDPTDATFNISNNTITLYGSGNQGLIRNNASTGVQTITSNLTLAASQQWLLNNASSGSVVVAGVIGQTSGVTAVLAKTGSGVLELRGANTFTGTFNAASGTTVLNNAAALAQTSGVVVSGPGALATSSASLLTAGSFGLDRPVTVVANTANVAAAVTIGGAAGATASTWSGTVTLFQPVSLTGGTAGTVTFSGAVADGAGLASVGSAVTKVNTGTVILGGNNTYTGATNASAGTLLVNNAAGSGTGTGVVTVFAGATLGGSGNISGGVAVSGNISGGAAAGTVGTLTTGSQTWNAGGGYVADFAGTAAGDKLLMSGLTVMASNASGSRFLVAPQNVALAAGTSYVIATDSNTSTGTVDPFNAALTAGSLMLAPGTALSPTTGDTLTLTSVPDGIGYDLLLNDVTASTPEPTSLLLAGVAIAPLALRRRRRR